MTSSSQQVDVISMIPTTMRNILSISLARPSTKPTSQLFTPASEIVTDVFQEDLLHQPLPSLPAPVNLAHAANHHTQALHPNGPTNLDFQLVESFNPYDFLHQDIRAGDNRHLIFATNQMLQLLSGTKNWYMDATFNVISDPFYQLFSIHAFISVITV